MIFRKMACLGATLSLLACCHAYVPPQSLPGNCPSSYKSYDLSFCWKIERGVDRFTIEGFATNTRFSYIEDLEVRAGLLDDRGKTVGESTAFLIPRQIPMDDTGSFTLTIPISAAGKPAKIKFFYRYRLTRVDDGKTAQFNSFVTDLR
jgi:hypothetical protein